MKPAVSLKLFLWLGIATAIVLTLFLGITQYGEPLFDAVPFFNQQSIPTEDSAGTAIERIEEHRARIEQKEDIEPLWVLAGQLDIREGTPRYWFGDIGGGNKDPKMYALDGDGVTHGTVYMARGSRIEKVRSLDQLVNRYRIYLAYYADRTTGDVFGVIRTVKPSKDTVTLELLEDPAQTPYVMDASRTVGAFDSTQLFDLTPVSPAQLKPGDIVRLKTLPPLPGEQKTTVTVTSATREAPRIKLYKGTVTKVSRSVAQTIRITLDSSPASFTADERTIVYRADNLPAPGLASYRERNLGIGMVQEGMTVSIMAYIDGDRWQIITLAIRQ